MILIPGLVGNACVIMKTHLTNHQIQSCQNIIYRAYARIDGDPNGSMGAMTGYFKTISTYGAHYITALVKYRCQHA